MSVRLLIAACSVLLLLPAPVLAQEPAASSPDAQPQTTPPPSARASRPWLRAYFHLDSTTLAAAETFDAIIGKSRLSMPGGGGEALNLWKGLFARVAFSSARETGSRVVVIDDEVIPLGIPVTVELKPLEIGGGWRFPAFAARRLVPYVGAGALRMGYRETSDFALGNDNTDTTFTGTVVFGGLEAALVSWVIAGVEAQYRTVPDAIGGGGVSEVFGENDLGGVTVRVLIGIRR